jgi:hypothetical protein
VGLYLYIDGSIVPDFKGSLALREPVTGQPVRCSESYDMYGVRRKSVTDYYDLSDYKCYNKFKACCKLCGQFTNEFVASDEAVFAQYLHCSKVHGYVFEEMNPAEFPVSDRKLQDLLITATEYNLPVPGYDSHDSCVKMSLRKQIVCVIHEGNEYGDKNWMKDL